MKSIITTILTIWIAFIATEARCDGAVLLTLQANRTSITVGDELQLLFTIKNASDKPYLFSRLNNLLAHPLIITDERGEGCRWLSHVVYELKYIPDRDDLFLLKPGEERTFTFNFILEKGDKSFLITKYRNELLKGYFLFYPEWKTYIYLANSQKISFQARYNASDGDRAAVKKYELTDLYEGSLKSALLEIAIDDK